MNESNEGPNVGVDGQFIFLGGPVAGGAGRGYAIPQQPRERTLPPFVCPSNSDPQQFSQFQRRVDLLDIQPPSYPSQWVIRNIGQTHSCHTVLPAIHTSSGVLTSVVLMENPAPPLLEQHLINQQPSSFSGDLGNYYSCQDQRRMLYQYQVPVEESLARASSVMRGFPNDSHQHLDQIMIMGGERVLHPSLPPPPCIGVPLSATPTSSNNYASSAPFGQESRGVSDLNSLQTRIHSNAGAATMVSDSTSSVNYTSTSSANQEAMSDSEKGSVYYSDSYRNFLEFRQAELSQGDEEPKETQKWDDIVSTTYNKPKQPTNGSTATHQKKSPADAEHPYAFLLNNLGKRSFLSASKDCPPTEGSPLPTKKKRKVKRPADRPRRPLTAFNYFFSEEREVILAHLPDTKANVPSVGSSNAGSSLPDSTITTTSRAKDDHNTVSLEAIEESMVQLSKEVLDALHIKIKANTQHLLDTEKEGDRVKKSHRKMHGKIPFQMLSKLVGKRWRFLALAKKQYYTDLSEKDNELYRKRMMLYEKMAVSCPAREGQGRI